MQCAPNQAPKPANDPDPSRPADGPYDNQPTNTDSPTNVDGTARLPIAQSQRHGRNASSEMDATPRLERQHIFAALHDPLKLGMDRTR